MSQQRNKRIKSSNAPVWRKADTDEDEEILSDSEVNSTYVAHHAQQEQMDNKAEDEACLIYHDDTVDTVDDAADDGGDEKDDTHKWVLGGGGVSGVAFDKPTSSPDKPHIQIPPATGDVLVSNEKGHFDYRPPCSFKVPTFKTSAPAFSVPVTATGTFSLQSPAKLPFPSLPKKKAPTKPPVAALTFHSFSRGAPPSKFPTAVPPVVNRSLPMVSPVVPDFVASSAEITDSTPLAMLPPVVPDFVASSAEITDGSTPPAMLPLLKSNSNESGSESDIETEDNDIGEQDGAQRKDTMKEELLFRVFQLSHDINLFMYKNYAADGTHKNPTCAPRHNRHRRRYEERLKNVGKCIIRLQRDILHSHEDNANATIITTTPVGGQWEACGNAATTKKAKRKESNTCLSFFQTSSKIVVLSSALYFIVTFMD